MHLYRAIKTAKGWVAIAGSENGLAGTSLHCPTREKAIESATYRLGDDIAEDDAIFPYAADAFIRYFDGKRTDFTKIRLNMSLYSGFMAKVIEAARGIGYGSVVTYGELAALAGSPRAARAVGNAMANNRTPIVVPCHRVIAAGGKIGGFSPGLEWKRELLKIEGIVI